MKKKNEYKVVELEVHGEIGAGSVVPFIPRNRIIPVALPVNADPEHYGSLVVRGVSLEDESIYDGDLLIGSYILHSRFSFFGSAFARFLGFFFLSLGRYFKTTSVILSNTSGTSFSLMRLAPYMSDVFHAMPR